MKKQNAGQSDSGRVSALSNLISRLAGCRVVVLGDVMLDHYIVGDVRRISPEAPVPVLEHHEERFMPGGAANVARNIAALGGRAELVGAVGADLAAEHLRQALLAEKIGVSRLLQDPSRPTTIKTRVMATHQQMLRVDRESRQPLAPVPRRRLHAALQRAVRGTHAIIVADYAKGVIDQETMDFVLSLARREGVPVCIDPKPARRLKMKGCALLTPNRKEAFEMAGMADEPVGSDPSSHPRLIKAITAIRREHAPACLLVTLGEAGMLIQEGNAAPKHLPTTARDVFDVSGAGDTVIATFALARAAGADAVQAAALANYAAGVVVGKLGAATVAPAELAERINSVNPLTAYS